MTADPRRLKLVDLLRLLNSTPLGEVIAEHHLKAHRNRARLRIGDSRRIDLVRYVAWLVIDRHAKQHAKTGTVEDDQSLRSGAQIAAAVVAMSPASSRPLLSSKQEAAIAAMLSSPTYAEAAERAGVGEASIYRWLNNPTFRTAFHRARRELMDAAIARVQAAAGQAVDVLVNVARSGRRDSDRVRAATTLLDHAYRGLESAEMLHGAENVAASAAFDTKNVVQLLAARLQQIDRSELPASEKARLSASLSDALMRAFSIDVLDKRLEALQTVLVGRKEQARKDAGKQRRAG